MTRRSVPVLLVAVLLVGAGGCASVDVAPAKGPAAQAPRPVYQIGQRWVRTDGVWELVYAGEDAYLFADAHRSEILLNRDFVPVRFIDRSPGSWRPGQMLNEPFSFHPAARLDWPLAVGKRGTSKGSWRFFYDETAVLPSPRNPAATYTRVYTFAANVDATFTWTVEAYEQVRVPAGTFDAYRLHFALTSDDPKAKTPPTWWMRTWYAPSVRQFVAAEGRNIGPLAFRLADVDPAAIEPMTVVLREPEEGAEPPRPRVGITGRVVAGAGIARVVVTVNGVEVTRQEPLAVPTEMTLDSAVTLREGRNVVIVTATDAAGRTRQEARTVVHDPARLQAAAASARTRVAAAQQAAAQADAARLAPTPWSAGERAAREAEAAVAARDYARAAEAFAAAVLDYERATATAAALARLAVQRSSARQVREAAERARAAAEAAGAKRWAASALEQAAAAEAEAAGAAGGEEFERAVGAYGRAESAYRAAEQQALARASGAASAERERQEVRRRQREAAERQARLADDARQAAATAGAARHAAAVFARAREQETAAAAALAGGDAAAAQDRYGAAEAGYREAAMAARAEAERAAWAERERAEAAGVLDAAAQARRLAERAGAARYAAEVTAQATAREREASAAAARGDHGEAARAGEAARQAWERAAAAARAGAAAPLRFAFDVPALVEREEFGLTGRLASARGVARVFVTLNGSTVWRRDEPSPATEVAVQVPMTLREGHNTIVVTAADTEGRIEQDVRVVRLDRPMPLALEVRYPPQDERLTQASSVVAAVAGSSRGVTEVRVTLNGQEVHRQTERRPQRSMVIAVPVTFAPGANAIVVTAVEDGGVTRRETRTVTLDAPRAEATPAGSAAAAREPELWAVVVGIGAYDNAAIPRLALTTPDAEAIHRVLVEVGGFKRENVLLLTDRTERRPTLRTLKWALGTFLARSARKGDTVVIFFAGHGAPEVDVGGRERDGLAKYLVPLDADPDDLYATGLPMDEFETIFSRIEAERVIVFLDACYSGAAGGRTFSSRRTRALNVDDGFLQRLVQSRGRVIVTAARAAEVSVEVRELGHGLFTYYLVRGLEGAADANADRVVTLQELYQYVEQEVTRHARTIGANQHPTMKGELEGLLPLVRIRR